MKLYKFSSYSADLSTVLDLLILLKRHINENIVDLYNPNIPICLFLWAQSVHSQCGTTEHIFVRKWTELSKLQVSFILISDDIRFFHSFRLTTKLCS